MNVSGVPSPRINLQPSRVQQLVAMGNAARASKPRISGHFGQLSAGPFDFITRTIAPSSQGPSFLAQINAAAARAQQAQQPQSRGFLASVNAQAMQAQQRAREAQLRTNQQIIARRNAANRLQGLAAQRAAQQAAAQQEAAEAETPEEEDSDEASGW
jgi:hypothetical protein